MLLSIITVAFRNLEGIVKTHASLAHLAQADDISFEWIVVDGGSNDGTREYLENLNGIYNLVLSLQCRENRPVFSACSPHAVSGLGF
ncbi:glycosyltransferase [Escherichia coli]|nr:glycosyltransferase [Escherichia coli]